jgi:hypothetical protein
MRHRPARLRNTASCWAWLFNEAERARRFQADVPALPGRLDLGRQAREREALVDVTTGHAEAAGDVVWVAPSATSAA